MHKSLLRDFLKNKPRGLSEGGLCDISYLFISSLAGLDSFILFHVCCFAASQSCVCSLNFLRVADEKKEEYLISTPSVLPKQLVCFYRTGEQS